MTVPIIGQPEPAAILPACGRMAVIALRIQDRRVTLHEHNSRAIPPAAAGLAAMQELANGHTPALRADRQSRYRLEQIAGGEPLPLEDLTAIGEENQLGRDVAVAGLVAILNCWGFDVVPRQAADASGALLISAGNVARAEGELMGAIVEAEADGVVTHAEAATIERRAHHLAQECQITARVAARRALNGKERQA